MLLRRRVLIAGVGVNLAAMPTTDTVLSLSRFFGHPNVQWISARDEESRRWIVDNLSPAVDVQVHPDLAAALPFPAIRPSRDQTLGLILRGGHTLNRSSMERVLAVARDNGYRVKAIVLGVGRTAREDLAAITDLHLDLTAIVVDDIDDISNELATCTVVASQRYHGSLAALLMGIPALGLATNISKKTDALFASFGRAEDVYSLDGDALLRALACPPDPLPPETIESATADAQSALQQIMEIAASVTLLPRPASVVIPEKPVREYGYNSGFFNQPEQVAAREAERSPRLAADPQAALSLGIELAWYRTQVRHLKGTDYLASLGALIDSNPILNELPAATRAVVCIPVAGAFESSHIYGTLSLYARQDPEALRQVVILPYVNYPDNSHTDSDSRTHITATINRIERAQADFSELQFAPVVEAFDHRLPSAHRGIIGYVARRLYDLAMMSVHWAIQAGRISPAADLLLIRNDADAVGMSRMYLRRFLDETKRHKATDIFQGGVRWGTHLYSDYPGYGVVMTLKEAMRALAHRTSADYQVVPGTNGSNVAIRMATLAAIGGVGNSPYFGAGGDDVELGLRVHSARSPQPGTSVRHEQSLGEPLGRRRVFGYVTGAQIDASGQRTLGTYLSNQTIIHSWDDFNSEPAGYRPRTKQPPRLVKTETSLPAAIDRIERNIDDIARHWYRDPQLLDSALRLVIGARDDNGALVYQQHDPANGTAMTFTDEGRRWLEHRLKTRSGGNEPYGQRIKRALYGGDDDQAPDARMLTPLQ